MELIINGQKHSFDSPISVAVLVDQLKLDTRKIAIECNLTIVPKSKYHDAMLADGDQLEIIHFIGGG